MTLSTDKNVFPRQLQDARVDTDLSSFRWTIVFFIGLVVAFLSLRWFGREQWFYLDEWSFLVDRKLTDPVSMLKPHDAHWVTVPATIYRTIYHWFWLSSYIFYQLPAIFFHLGVVSMVWLTMRQLGVRALIATATALTFAFYGAGHSNILQGFQIAFTGPIALGLAYLLITTKDEPTVRSDIAGMAFGLMAIMCSAVGVPMVGGVVLALLIQRGYRVAALHLLTLGLIFIVWYILFAAEYVRNGQHVLNLSMFMFIWRMLQGCFIGFGHNPYVAVGIAVVAVIGMAHAFRSEPAVKKLCIVAALIASSLAFMVLTTFGRAKFDVEGLAEGDRYVYVVAALMLPIIGLGSEVLARYWVLLGVVPLLLLSIGLPGNIELLSQPQYYKVSNRELITAIAYSPFLDQLPENTRVFSNPLLPNFAPTAGFLRGAIESGRLSALKVPTSMQLDASVHIALHQTGDSPLYKCPSVGKFPAMAFERGTRIVFSGHLVVVAEQGTDTSNRIHFDSRYGDIIEIVAGPIDPRLRSIKGRAPNICRIDR